MVVVVVIGILAIIGILAGGGSLGWSLGAGYGIRVRLPWVQYLGLDVGYPVVKHDDISPFVVNIALGWSY